MLLSNEIIQKIKHIQLKARYLSSGVLSGEYISAFKGLGMEFEKVREYILGDDIRHIDWNVTARMNSPYVKVYHEEREQTLMLIVDVSSSQNFGTTARFKNEIATELAAIIAFLAIKNNDKVGLIIFSDHVEQYIPPKKGRSHVWRIIRTVLTHKGVGKTTHIASAGEYLLKMCHKKSTCFLISDFYAKDYERTLQVMNKKHDLVCVVTADKWESELEDVGLVEFQDAETGEFLTVDTSSKKIRTAFKELEKKREDNLLHFFRQNQIGSFKISTDKSVVDPFSKFIRTREKRA